LGKTVLSDNTVIGVARRTRQEKLALRKRPVRIGEFLNVNAAMSFQIQEQGILKETLEASSITRFRQYNANNFLKKQDFLLDCLAGIVHFNNSLSFLCKDDSSWIGMEVR
jgi:hypothetical protein